MNTLTKAGIVGAIGALGIVVFRKYTAIQNLEYSAGLARNLSLNKNYVISWVQEIAIRNPNEAKVTVQGIVGKWFVENEQLAITEYYEPQVIAGNATTIFLVENKVSLLKLMSLWKTVISALQGKTIKPVFVGQITGEYVKVPIQYETSITIPKIY